MKARPMHVLGLAALALAASGCAEAVPPPAHAPAPANATASDDPLDGGVVPDAWIAAVLGRELRSDRYLSSAMVGVDSVLGVVKLEGVVDARLAKTRAVEIAHVVRGVRAIIDRVDVAPHSRPDRALDFAVAAALGEDPVTSGLRIGARANEGVVLLSGDVGSEAERRIAEIDVLAIPGVKDVLDELVVRAGASDDVRAAAAAARVMDDDHWLDDSHVQVVARRGVVYLGGWVGSAQEWARAERDASTASPAGSVDASALRIDRWIDDGTLRGRPFVARSDGDLGQALLDAYVRDPRVQPFVPTLDIHEGVVILTGIAPTEATARAAEEDARNLPGMTAVRADIKPAKDVVSQNDAAVRSQVVAALARDPALAREDVAVEVRDGRVYLHGTVANERDRIRAISIATSAPGARDVQDGLVLAPPRLGVTSRQPPR